MIFNLIGKIGTLFKTNKKNISSKSENINGVNSTINIDSSVKSDTRCSYSFNLINTTNITHINPTAKIKNNSEIVGQEVEKFSPEVKENIYKKLEEDPKKFKIVIDFINETILATDEEFIKMAVKQIPELVNEKYWKAENRIRALQLILEKNIDILNLIFWLNFIEINLCSDNKLKLTTNSSINKLILKKIAGIYKLPDKFLKHINVDDLDYLLNYKIISESEFLSQSYKNSFESIDLETTQWLEENIPQFKLIKNNESIKKFIFRPTSMRTLVYKIYFEEDFKNIRKDIIEKHS